MKLYNCSGGENPHCAITGRFLACCFVLAFAAVSHCPVPGNAACTETKTVVYLSAPEKSQTDALYLPLLQAWEAERTHSVSPIRAPGRGGSYALSRLLLDKRPECAFAAMQVPATHFLTQAPNRMVQESEIRPLLLFAYAPHALWVSEKSPVRSLRDLVALAREKEATRGARLVIAGIGSHTDQHLANLALNRALGIASTYYPLSGTPEASSLAENDSVQACWGYALPPSSMPGMRPLVVAAKERGRALPDVPTFEEQGIRFSSGSHFGLAMAAASPEDSQKSLAERFALLLDSPALKAQYAALGATPLNLVQEELANFMKRQNQEADRLLEEYPLIPRRYLGQ